MSTRYDDRPDPDPPDRHAHHWIPISFRVETQLLDPQGRVLIRQPDQEDAHVYCVCMGCHAWTYMQVGWVGYYLPPPDRWLDYFDGVGWVRRSRERDPRRYVVSDTDEIAAEAEE